MARNDKDTREFVLLMLGCFICAVWAIAVLVQVFYPDHIVPAEVHGVMLVLVPLLFGAAAWQSRKTARESD